MSWRPANLTITLAIAAAVSVVLVHADPWGEGPSPIRMVSTQSAARRLFPNLGERDVAQASVEIARADGRRIRLVPSADGPHQLFVGEVLLGFADEEAVEGLWASLRMATTLRAVPAGASIGAIRGTLEVVVGEERLILRLADATADRAGIYGVLVHEQETPWVVESELLAILEQEPEGWISRRLLALEPGQAAALRWPERTIARGADEIWRVTAGDPRLLLSSAAVDTRLDRLLAARVDPLLPREVLRDDELAPWLTVEDREGRAHAVRVGGECPDRPELRIVDRGPGMLGCVDAGILEPWPLADRDAGFVEPQLLPHAYGRVTAIELRRPTLRRLRRFGGGWLLEEGGRSVEVDEGEVYRWYEAVATTPVEIGGGPLTVDVEIAIETDSGQGLVVTCGGESCARDEGPSLRLGRPLGADVAFTRETFAERRLMASEPGEARALEILPGSGEGVRQSVRLDLGVWRLDAPNHPDGNGALDEVRLETLLATLGSARAEAWTEVPAEAPLRTLRVERAPARERASELALELYPECVARVPGQPRAARLAGEVCSILAGDLLYDDPLRFWIGRARLVEVERGGERRTLRAGPGGWTEEGGGEVEPDLAAWDAWRARGIRRGTPTGATIERLRIHRTTGAVVVAERGEGWLRVAGSEWYYVAAGE